MVLAATSLVVTVVVKVSPSLILVFEGEMEYVAPFEVSKIMTVAVSPT